MRFVSIFGSARLDEGHKYYMAAKNIAQMLSQKGFGIITGGGGGIMMAANHGASEAGGISIGIKTAAVKREQPNPFCNEIIHFDELRTRRGVLIDRADRFVIMPGGIGTLDELTEALVLSQIGQKPAKIALFGRSFWAPLLQMLETMRSENMLTQDETRLAVFDDEHELVEYIAD